MMEFFVLLIELLGFSRLVRRVGLLWAMDVFSGVSNCSFVATTSKLLQHLNASRIRFALFSLSSSFFLFFVLCMWSRDVPGMPKCFARLKQKAVRKEMTNKKMLVLIPTHVCADKTNSRRMRLLKLMMTVIPWWTKTGPLWYPYYGKDLWMRMKRVR